MNYAIQDFGLCALQLEDKYSKYDYHWMYTRSKWAKSGEAMDYWKWVESKIDIEQEEFYLGKKGV